MPQPLTKSKLETYASVNFWGGDPFDANPRLAQMIATVLHRYSQLEAEQLALFIQIMGGSSSNAATIYGALDSRLAKNNALAALSKSVLQPPEHAVVMAILVHAKSCQRLRDPIAHGIWGYSPNYPNALIVVDAKMRSYSTAEESADRARVYREADFKEIVNKIIRLSVLERNFALYLTGHEAFHTDFALSNFSADLGISHRQANDQQK